MIKKSSIAYRSVSSNGHDYRGINSTLDAIYIGQLKETFGITSLEQWYEISPSSKIFHLDKTLHTQLCQISPQHDWKPWFSQKGKKIKPDGDNLVLHYNGNIYEALKRIHPLGRWAGWTFERAASRASTDLRTIRAEVAPLIPTGFCDQSG